MITGIVILILLCIAFATIVFGAVMGVKNDNTYKQHSRIADAIYEYQINHIHEHGKRDYSVWYDDMCEYDETLWRVFDWGYKNILPPKKLEKIKPYIK